MVNTIIAMVFISLLAPVRTVSPDATKNRKIQVSRQAKAKRTTNSRRVNTKRTQRQRHNQRYGTQRRTGNQTRRRNSRATTNTNKQVNKRTTNRIRRSPHVQHTSKQGNKSTTGKASPLRRPPGQLSVFQREVLRYQMQTLLSDPQMGSIYRKILKSKKKRK